MALSKKEFIDIVTQRVYLLAFLVQMIMVIGIIYTSLLYTSVTDPTVKGVVQTQIPKIGVVGDIGTEFEGLTVVNLNSTNYTAALSRRNLVAVVVAPENFQEDIKAGNDAKVLLILDNTNVLSGYADATITQALQKLSNKIKKERISSYGDPEAILSPIFIERATVGEEHKVLMDSPKFVELMYGFLIPFILLLPTFLSMNMTTDSIVGEKERKTYEILISSPLSKREVVLGKTLPIIFISLIQALAWILLLEIRGVSVYNTCPILLLLALINTSFIGAGVIISAFSEDIKDADIGVTLGIIAFSILFFAPVTLTKEIYRLSPVTLLSKLSSNPVVPLDKIIVPYLLLLVSGVVIVFIGGRLLDWKEELRL